MPSRSIEQLTLNDAIKELGATEFYKKGDVLTIKFGEGEGKMLQFDVDKNKILTTKKNLEEAAASIDFDAGLLAKLKHILGRDYEEYLKIPKQNDDGKKDKDKDKDHQLWEPCR
jgi:hypothetical protein